MVAIGRELGFDSRLRRGRCIGHIINLAAKALLFGSSDDAFEKQLFWLKKGHVGKLYNLVVDVRNVH
jgi:hypothetical protein